MRRIRLELGHSLFGLGLAILALAIPPHIACLAPVLMAESGNESKPFEEERPESGHSFAKPALSKDCRMRRWLAVVLPWSTFEHDEPAYRSQRSPSDRPVARHRHALAGSEHAFRNGLGTARRC